MLTFGMKIALKAHIAMPEDCYLVKTSIRYAIDSAGRQVWQHKSSCTPYRNWIMTWDGERGEIEVFHAKTLKHQGVLHSNGDFKEHAIKGRILRLQT